MLNTICRNQFGEIWNTFALIIKICNLLFIIYSLEKCNRSFWSIQVLRNVALHFISVYQRRAPFSNRTLEGLSFYTSLIEFALRFCSSAINYPLFKDTMCVYVCVCVHVCIFIEQTRSPRSPIEHQYPTR